MDPLLSESEAIEWIEFDPVVDPENSWEPPRVMKDFLEKYFNRALSTKERKARQPVLAQLHGEGQQEAGAGQNNC